MYFRKRPLPSSRESITIAAIALGALLLIGGLLAADIQLGRLVGGGENFYTPWDASRQFLLQQETPYRVMSQPSANRGLYALLPWARHGLDFLTTPFFLLLFFFPFALIPDADVARGVWIMLGQAALLGSAFIALGLTGRRVSRRFLALYSLLAVFGFYPAMAIADGSPAVMLSLIYPLMLWAYLGGEDEVAGALMAVSLFAWEIGLAFLLLFLWRVFHDRRWRVLAGFGMAMVILLSISFLLYPGWVLPFLAAVAAMARTPNGFNLPLVLGHLVPTNGVAISRGISIGGAGLLILEWATGRESDYHRFLWTACLALAVMPLSGLRTEIGQLVAIGPAFALISVATMGRSRIHAWLGILFLLIAFVAPWGLLLRSYFVPNVHVSDVLAVLYPGIAILGLYWTRWWFLRPHGTWFDQVRRLKQG